MITRNRKRRIVCFVVYEIAFRFKSGLWASHLLSFVLCNFMTFLSFKVSFWFFDFCDNSEFKFSKLYRKCKFYAILLFLVTKGFTAEKHEKRNKNRERILVLQFFKDVALTWKDLKSNIYVAEAFNNSMIRLNHTAFC